MQDPGVCLGLTKKMRLTINRMQFEDLRMLKVPLDYQMGNLISRHSLTCLFAQMQYYVFLPLHGADLANLNRISRHEVSYFFAQKLSDLLLPHAIDPAEKLSSFLSAATLAFDFQQLVSQQHFPS